jgi:hypothetical protein
MPRRLDQRHYNVAYYAANREREIERVRTRQVATIEFLRKLRDVPCTDCGGRFQGHQMDFDHLDPSAKRFRISSAPAALKNRAELLAEIAKCDIVCANCHRRRTQRQHRRRLAMRTPGASSRIDEKRNQWRYHADVLDQLRSVPCTDCGETFAPCATDFDHRDGTSKGAAVTRMIGRASLERILAEAAKCAIVCANCHRLRTFERRTKRTA